MPNILITNNIISHLSSINHGGYNGIVEFKDYLLNEFWKWEKTTGKRQSMSSFALYLGVKQSAFAHWIGGNIIPGKENVDKLAAKLGNEIYKVLGLPEPEEPNVPPSARAAYEAASERVKALGVPADSPQAEQIFIEEMSRAGYKLISRQEEP